MIVKAEPPGSAIPSNRYRKPKNRHSDHHQDCDEDHRKTHPSALFIPDPPRDPKPDPVAEPPSDTAQSI